MFDTSAKGYPCEYVQPASTSAASNIQLSSSRDATFRLRLACTAIRSSERSHQRQAPHPEGLSSLGRTRLIPRDEIPALVRLDQLVFKPWHVLDSRRSNPLGVPRSEHTLVLILQPSAVALGRLLIIQ